MDRSRSRHHRHLGNHQQNQAESTKQNTYVKGSSSSKYLNTSRPPQWQTGVPEQEASYDVVGYQPNASYVQYPAMYQQRQHVWQSQPHMTEQQKWQPVVNTTHTQAYSEGESNKAVQYSQFPEIAYSQPVRLEDKSQADISTHGQQQYRHGTAGRDTDTYQLQRKQQYGQGTPESDRDTYQLQGRQQYRHGTSESDRDTYQVHGKQRYQHGADEVHRTIYQNQEESNLYKDSDERKIQPPYKSRNEDDRMEDVLLNKSQLNKTGDIKKHIFEDTNHSKQYSGRYSSPVNIGDSSKHHMSYGLADEKTQHLIDMARMQVPKYGYMSEKSVADRESSLGRYGEGKIGNQNIAVSGISFDNKIGSHGYEIQGRNTQSQEGMPRAQSHSNATDEMWQKSFESRYMPGMDTDSGYHHPKVYKQLHSEPDEKHEFTYNEEVLKSGLRRGQGSNDETGVSSKWPKSPSPPDDASSLQPPRKRKKFIPYGSDQANEMLYEDQYRQTPKSDSAASKAVDVMGKTSQSELLYQQKLLIRQCLDAEDLDRETASELGSIYSSLSQLQQLSGLQWQDKKDLGAVSERVQWLTQSGKNLERSSQERDQNMDFESASLSSSSSLDVDSALKMKNLIEMRLSAGNMDPLLVSKYKEVYAGVSKQIEHNFWKQEKGMPRQAAKDFVMHGHSNSTGMFGDEVLDENQRYVSSPMFPNADVQLGQLHPEMGLYHDLRQVDVPEQYEVKPSTHSLSQGLFLGTGNQQYLEPVRDHRKVIVEELDHEMSVQENIQESPEKSGSNQSWNKTKERRKRRVRQLVRNKLYHEVENQGQDWWCNICEQKLMTKDADNHIGSKLHIQERKKLQRLLDDSLKELHGVQGKPKDSQWKETEPLRDNVVLPTLTAKDRLKSMFNFHGENRFCLICNQNVDSESRLTDHNEDSQHKLMKSLLEQIETMTQIIEDFGNADRKEDAFIKAHTIGAKLEMSKESKVKDFCAICNVYEKDLKSKNLKTHLGGARHERMKELSEVVVVVKVAVLNNDMRSLQQLMESQQEKLDFKPKDTDPWLCLVCDKKKNPQLKEETHYMSSSHLTKRVCIQSIANSLGNLLKAGPVSITMSQRKVDLVKPNTKRDQDDKHARHSESKKHEIDAKDVTAVTKMYDKVSDEEYDDFIGELDYDESSLLVDDNTNTHGQQKQADIKEEKSYSTKTRKHQHEHSTGRSEDYKQKGKRHEQLEDGTGYTGEIVGKSFTKPGFYCKLCKKFFADPNEAFYKHCQSRGHCNKLGRKNE